MTYQRACLFCRGPLKPQRRGRPASFCSDDCRRGILPYVEPVTGPPVRELRPCKRCGKPATSQKHWYCDECRWAQQKKRRMSSAERRHPLSPAQRGYGPAHQRLRRQWARRVDRGEVACGRCGYPIIPGAPWDLGHPNDDKALPPTPWHRRCNRQYAATVTLPRANRARKGRS
jgi:hypothetical protein